MVCVADEIRVECIIRDISRPSQTLKYEFSFPASIPVSQLIRVVANNMHYEPNAIQLTLQSGTSDKVFTEATVESLEEAGFYTEPGSRNALILETIKSFDNKRVYKKIAENESPANSEIDITILPTENSTYPVHPLPPPPSTLLPPVSSPAGDYACSGSPTRHDTGYVGLVNQAMTCYLNSLLQALYMTPEFRNALYKWKFDSRPNTNAPKCIPFQLQKLFLNLQTSSKSAVETTELTRSFGWESGEVWQQHDIQELCRVMFDALEQEFKDTEQADLINQLYQGKMIDYVKCLECGREKSREDTFLDIPLPVRPFGSTVAYENIEEALRAFVQPETLDGNNQYFCENCNKKCDAHKGLKFLKFPYLLTLHLKRFDFDYNTMHRIKLNDKVVFKEDLDLNSFVDWTTGIEEDEEDGSPVRGDDSSTGDSALDEETSHALDQQTIDQDQEEDEGIDMSTSSGNHIENEKNRQQSLNKGPCVYQLYSIMIHSGSASGGHYYAYIKDFAKDEWFCFNDQSVTRITLSDIAKTYGGGPNRTYYSGAYSSSTNAYMLMYRQIDKERNASAITEQFFPPHIMKLLEEVKESEEKERAMRARQEEMVTLRVYTPAGPENILRSQNNSKILCHNETPLIEVLNMAHQSLLLEDEVPIEQCRLVSYNRTQELMEVSFEGRDQEKIGDILASLGTPNCEFFLETREKNQIFTRYSSGDISLTSYVVDPENEEIVSVHNLRTNPRQYLPGLREFLCKVIPLSSPDVHLVLVKPLILVYLTEETQLLNKLGFYSTNRLFICSKDLEPDTNDSNFESSKLYKFVEKVQNIIILHLVLPDTSQDTLERLLIPPLTEAKLNGNNNRRRETSSSGDKEMEVQFSVANGVEEEGVCSAGAGGTSDQSTSEDSSLTDSERTIIGDVPNEGQLSSPSDSEQLSSPEGQQPVKIRETNGDLENYWDEEVEIINKPFYFKATPYTASGTKMLRVVVDRNVNTTPFKAKLEPFVGVAAKYMKLYRGPEVSYLERGELANSFSRYKDEERISVKLHRVLSECEHRIKLFLLVINSSKPVELICEWIVSRGETIGSTKKAILRELERKHDIKISYERCRLWKKIQIPGVLLDDSQTWDEVCGYSQKEVCGSCQEVFVQEGEAEGEGTVIFTRQWRSSTLTFDPFKEIVFQGETAEDLKKKLSEISEIPPENIKFVKGMTSFSILSMHSELDWYHEYSDSKTTWSENGIVIFYRDCREELKTLTREEQQEVSNREYGRLHSPPSNFSSYSPRKEKALKIYLDITPRQTSRTYIDID